jgi:hypothetical protein
MECPKEKIKQIWKKTRVDWLGHQNALQFVE